jgi:hypothetical protein
MGEVLFKVEIITKKCKNGMRSFKNFLVKNYLARNSEIYLKAF